MTFEIGTAQFRSVEIAPKSRLCVNKSPIRYDFRAGAKAIRYSVNMALCDCQKEGTTLSPVTICIFLFHVQTESALLLQNRVSQKN